MLRLLRSAPDLEQLVDANKAMFYEEDSKLPDLGSRDLFD